MTPSLPTLPTSCAEVTWHYYDLIWRMVTVTRWNAWRVARKTICNRHCVSIGTNIILTSTWNAWCLGLLELFADTFMSFYVFGDAYNLQRSKHKINFQWLSTRKPNDCLFDFQRWSIVDFMARWQKRVVLTNSESHKVPLSSQANL